jgi:hypothetical protein
MDTATLKPFVHNRYFYGQLLDVHHFELEQSYFNQKRWLLNRLVTGYGVVCGLDVQLGEDGRSVVVLPGVAVDKWGREIVVPRRSEPVALAGAEPGRPPDPGTSYPCDDGDWVHVCVCFHECPVDPAPVLACDCETTERCAPGATRESYCVTVREGRAPAIDPDCAAPDVISGGRINHQALAIRVTRGCPVPPPDPCVPLASVRLPAPGDMAKYPEIDITVRPVVYGNDVLFALVLALTRETQHRPWSGK